MTICGKTDCEGCIVKYANDINFCKTERRKKNMNTNFLELIKQHPDYPIIPRVNADIIYDDMYGWYYGEFGYACLGEFLDYSDVNEKCYDDRDDFIEDWMEDRCDDIELRDMNEQEFEDCAIKVCDEQKWQKVIFVNINPFEGV